LGLRGTQLGFPLLEHSPSLILIPSAATKNPRGALVFIDFFPLPPPLFLFFEEFLVRKWRFARFPSFRRVKSDLKPLFSFMGLVKVGQAQLLFFFTFFQ